jgi:hypothetical protein
MTKKHIILIIISLFLILTFWLSFDGLKRNYQVQVAQAKLSAADIGYQAGYSQGKLDLNTAIINNLAQYGYLMVNFPNDKNGDKTITDDEIIQLLLKPVQINETTTQEKESNK